MAIDLQTQFSTRDGEQSYGRTIAELIRAEQHDLAEEKLMTGLASLRVPLADLCLETRADLVRLTHWDTLQQFIFRPTVRGSLCTAVGLNLSNYGAPPQMIPELFVEPSVEVSFYADEDFPFSTKSREEILAENMSYPVPWIGGGSGAAPFYAMDVIAAAAIYESGAVVCAIIPKVIIQRVENALQTLATRVNKVVAANYMDLEYLANETGGEVLAHKPKKLDTTFQTLIDHLRSRYNLAFVSTNKKRDGTTRKLKLDIDAARQKSQDRLVIKARRSYIAPRS